MFVIRHAIVDDVPALLKLARMVHFINLPADPDILRTKILWSRNSFAGQAPSPRERQFMFVLEDSETGNVIGTSSIISCLSWPGHPHTFLQVRKREHYSKDLQTGQVHMTLQLGTDESGPSEIGGLVLSPSYRGHEQRLGMMLSLVRFHFIGRHREWFADRIIAEMMGPLTPDSRNLFWDALGRRFINLSFAEADLFCQHSKEFITALFPKEEIYVSLLPPEARNVIGKVGQETEPAKKLLEGIGFREMGHVDPFDGGPYLEAKVADIELVRATRLSTLGRPNGNGKETAFVSVHSHADFRAVRTAYTESAGRVSIPPDVQEVLGAQVGDEVAITPLPEAQRKSRGTPDGETRRNDSTRPPARRRVSTRPPEAVS